MTESSRCILLQLRVSLDLSGDYVPIHTFCTVLVVRPILLAYHRRQSNMQLRRPGVKIERR